MSAWALVVDSHVREVTSQDPALHYPRAMPWEPCPDMVAPGWTFDGSAYTAPAHPAPAPKPTSMVPLAFLGRFTTAEYAGICSAALANRDVLGWVLQATAAQAVDLTDPRTKAGLEALVSAGLLSAAREAEILTP